MLHMKISIGSDHAGFEQKQQLVDYLVGLGHDVIDHGPDTDERVDYPDYAVKVAMDVSFKRADYGVLVCGTGIGMSMAANKHRGIRAAACSDTFSARLTRVHNNANVLCFGERVVGMGLALDLVDAFVDAEFEGGKHQRRVDMITQIEISESNV